MNPIAYNNRSRQFFVMPLICPVVGGNPSESFDFVTPADAPFRVHAIAGQSPAYYNTPVPGDPSIVTEVDIEDLTGGKRLTHWTPWPALMPNIPITGAASRRWTPLTMPYIFAPSSTVRIGLWTDTFPAYTAQFVLIGEKVFDRNAPDSVPAYRHLYPHIPFGMEIANIAPAGSDTPSEDFHTPPKGLAITTRLAMGSKNDLSGYVAGSLATTKLSLDYLRISRDGVTTFDLVTPGTGIDPHLIFGDSSSPYDLPVPFFCDSLKGDEIQMRVTNNMITDSDGIAFSFFGYKVDY